MPLLKNGKFIEDTWHNIEGEAPLPAGEPIIVSLERLLGEDGEALYHCGCRLGVRLRAGEPVEALESWIDRLALVALEFPAFNDGRAFSAAAMLREEYGFAGEIRALGEVLVDQYQFMRRVGFDSFEIAEGRPLESWQSAAAEVSLAYQIDTGGESKTTHVWQARRARVAEQLAAE